LELAYCAFSDFNSIFYSNFNTLLELGKDFLFAIYFIFIPKFGDGEYLDGG
jgi:hypothetical protein